MEVVVPLLRRRARRHLPHGRAARAQCGRSRFAPCGFGRRPRSRSRRAPRRGTTAGVRAARPGRLRHRRAGAGIFLERCAPAARGRRCDGDRHRHAVVRGGAGVVGLIVSLSFVGFAIGCAAPLVALRLRPRVAATTRSAGWKKRCRRRSGRSPSHWVPVIRSRRPCATWAVMRTSRCARRSCAWPSRSTAANRRWRRSTPCSSVFPRARPGSRGACA